MTDQDAKRSFFDRWSRTYDNPLLQAMVYRPVQDAVVAALHTGATGRVLDVGCGTGLLTTRLAEAGGTVVGCDYSHGMLAAATRRSRRPHWVQADAMALPIADASIDALVCTESFHWYPDQSLALREFARVLVAGGRLYVALINPPSTAVSEWTHHWSRRIRRPLYWPTRARLRDMVTDAGLRVVSQQRLRRIPTTLLLPAALTVAEKP